MLPIGSDSAAGEEKHREPELSTTPKQTWFHYFQAFLIIWVGKVGGGN